MIGWLQGRITNVEDLQSKAVQFTVKRKQSREIVPERKGTGADTAPKLTHHLPPKHSQNHIPLIPLSAPKSIKLPINLVITMVFSTYKIISCGTGALTALFTDYVSQG